MNLCRICPPYLLIRCAACVYRIRADMRLTDTDRPRASKCLSGSPAPVTRRHLLPVA